MVFHWRIFILSLANRLYSIFLHWLEEPGVPRVSGILLSSTRNTGYGSSARYEPCSKTKLSYYLFPLTGGGAPLPFWGPSQSFGFSLPPLSVSSDLRLLSTNTCWYPLCDPHSLLTVTFFTGFHCSFQREDSINLTSIISVGYHVTIYIYIYIWVILQEHPFSGFLILLILNCFNSLLFSPENLYIYIYILFNSIYCNPYLLFLPSN